MDNDERERVCVSCLKSIASVLQRLYKRPAPEMCKDNLTDLTVERMAIKFILCYLMLKSNK